MDPGNAGGHEDPEEESDGGGEDWLDWEMWWQIIVHRGSGAPEPPMAPVPAQAWSLDPKDPPFPLNLEATWYCTMILAVMIAVHIEIDTTWMLSHGYIHYFLRIAHKTLLAIAISFGSTLAFEVIGNVLDLTRETLLTLIYAAVRSFLIMRFHWGTVDEQGNLGFNEELEFDEDQNHLREPIAAAIINVITVAFNFIFTVLARLIPVVFGSGLVWLASRVSTDLSIFLYNLETYLSLPTPPTDGTVDIKTLLWEYGVPMYSQIWAAAFIYLFVFLFMARAETPRILHGERMDGFSMLAYNLLRATSIHLLSYTAYQLVCFLVNIVPSPWFFEVMQEAPRSPFIRNLGNFNPSIGTLTLVANAVARSACNVFIRILIPFWLPYIVWLSIRTRAGARHRWLNRYRPFMHDDMDIFEDMRTIEKATMAAWFGLRSSWPSRMRMGVEGE